MLKCNSCKNPVPVTSIYCEWCGERIVHETKEEQSGSVNDSKGLRDFISILNEIETEIVTETSGAGTWGALDGLLSRAFGNTKIDSLNQKRITVIRTFPLSKNPDELLETANMSVSNYRNTTIHSVAISENARNENKMNKPLKDAWRSRAEQAIAMLSVYARTDDFIRQQTEQLASQLRNEKKGWQRERTN